ncbi:MAG: glycosyltransferase family 2 protein [Planctomycetota bacterium]
MKLIIQIPCLNEEETLPETLADLPRDVEGFDRVEWLVIDDGSTDRTVEIAKEHGVDHVVSHAVNRGLASGFLSGLDAAIKAGADVIVNTDADNQYNAADIPALTKPILGGEADMVIGARPIAETEHFSPIKKFLQKFGSGVVRIASGTDVADAPSGFRAISRDAAMQLNVFNPYTYTLETIIQAGQKNIHTVNVPIRTNGPTRPSRLVKSIRAYVTRSMGTILRISMLYRAKLFFTWLGMAPLSMGFLLYARWVVLFFIEEEYRSRVPSLVVGTVCLLIGFQLLIFGLIADLLAANRRISEDCQLRLRRLEADHFTEMAEHEKSSAA